MKRKPRAGSPARGLRLSKDTDACRSGRSFTVLQRGKGRHGPGQRNTKLPLQETGGLHDTVVTGKLVKFLLYYFSPFG